MTTQGVRYPTFAFITGGAGQADDGIPPQPFETFCYDSALLQARIENFNVVPYTSVLPKELYGKILPINDKIVSQFKHGAVLEVIMAGHGASRDEHKAIATGLGVCWGKDKNGELIGGWAAEYVEFFDTQIDDEIAKGHAEMWLNKSLNHELSIRGVEKHSEFQMWHNYVNITQQFGYSLNRTCSGQLDNGTPVSMSELQPGDIVIFNKGNSSKRATHVGLYIGNNQFIHASTAKVGVIISKLSDAYYTTGFVGGRRIV